MADEKHAGSMKLNHNTDSTRDPDALAPQGAMQGANPVADGYLAHLQKTWGAENRLIAQPAVAPRPAAEAPGGQRHVDLAVEAQLQALWKNGVGDSAADRP
jgi:hypothetical protein